jgi:8-oxo-dGTP diphosphatase
MGTLSTVPLPKMTANYTAFTTPLAGFGPDYVAGLERADADASGRGRARSPFWYAVVARDYAELVAAGERRPVQVMAARSGRSPDAIRTWLRRAREAGFLTHQQGKASGQLTDKARALLAAAGLTALDTEPASDPLAVVAAVITSDRGVLVARRVDGKPPWGFISGAIGPTERPEDAAVRETDEETGLVIEAGEVIGERVHPRTGRAMTYIAARPTGGTDAAVLDAAELAEVRWVSLAEALELLPDMFGPVRDHLARVLAPSAREL